MNLNIVDVTIWVFTPKQYKKAYNSFSLWVDAAGQICNTQHPKVKQYIGQPIQVAIADYNKTHQAHEIR